MNLLKAYSKGFTSAVKSKKMTSLIYLIILLLGLTVAVPFFRVMKNEMGYSMSVYSLLHGFDFTSYSDFLLHSGKAIKPFTSIIFWISIFYIIFSVFLSGGILHIIYNKENKFSLKEFFYGCGNYILPFLKLALINFILQVIILVIVYFPLTLILTGLSKSVESEATLVYVFIAGVVVQLILSSLIFLISDYSKVIMFVNESRKAIASFWLSTKFVFRYFFKVVFLFLLLLILPISAIAAYLIFSQEIFIRSKITFLVVVLVQQVFVWLRVWFKIWFWGSELSLFTGIFNIVRKSDSEIEEEWNVEELTVDS
ncbi:hypothetical protein BMS3Abin04_00369 [bacterium BMS3Abin04]|nr:hypothetical protein BMS3Abin04_00369 [bacterium BMS3Abin04]